MENAYAAIGRAVIAAQRFETMLVPMFEFFRMVSDPEYRDKTKGYVSAGKFKVPTSVIVKLLAGKGDIAPDLEARLNRYVEDRHLLIHRWMIERGWPSPGDAVGFVPVIELAKRIEEEANTLTKSIVSYMLNSQDVQDKTEYSALIARMFHDGHRGSE